jgi:hypothetical protein
MNDHACRAGAAGTTIGSIWLAAEGFLIPNHGRSMIRNKALLANHKNFLDGT